MKWDDDGISVCESLHRDQCYTATELSVKGNFYRVAIPSDILEGIPDPSNWPNPTATLEPAGCNISNFFMDHQIIFGASRLIYFKEMKPY